MFAKHIELIEKKIFSDSLDMNFPILERDLGALVFEATLFKGTKNPVYKEKALRLYSNLINNFSNSFLHSGFFEGFEGVFYSIGYLKKSGIITDTSILNDLEKELRRSLKINFQSNYYDPLHGSIGKLLYYMNSSESSINENRILFDQCIESLYTNGIHDGNRIYWYDLNEHGETTTFVNLGMAHGLPGVLCFLIRLKESDYSHQYLDSLISGVLNTIISSKNGISGLSVYPNYLALDPSDRIMNSRIGWCYGDLGVGWSLLYASKVLNDSKIKKEAYTVINSLATKRLSNSNLDHFEDYNFLDTGFCHGLGGISFIFWKMNEIVNNPLLQNRIDYWKFHLEKNLDTQLKLDGDIYLPWYRQNDKQDYTLDRVALLNGFIGTGLAMIAFEYGETDWSDLFLIF